MAQADEYELKIDEQVEKFLELKHQLNFFIVTASVATVGYTLNYFITALPNADAGHRGTYVGLVACAAILGLFTAAFSLMSLQAEITSFRMHLKYRYQRMSFEALSKQEQERWTALNARARRLETWAFGLLVASVVVQAFSFMSFLVNE